MRRLTALVEPRDVRSVAPAAGAWRCLRRRPERRRGPGSDGLIDGVVAVAAALRAGAPVAQAWRRGLGVHTEAGVPEPEALLRRCGEDPATARAVHAAAVLAARTGAPLAAVLDRVGAGLAQDAEATNRRSAALAGPRATARLLAWLPMAGLGLGAALGADPVAVLLDGRVGTGLLGTGAALTLIGVRWSGRLVADAQAAGR